MHKMNTILMTRMSERSDEEGDLSVVTRKKFKRPPRYRVLLHNDDYTTMEFVVYILKSVFSKTTGEAQEIMLKVHNEGRGQCGVYTHEVAESKMKRVSLEAKQNGHPLLCTIEPE
ncbi:ATP-dependent Clp protease adaptor protein ClpS [Bacteriovorax sp. DB6_IX]|nr:ATP-dependent Clp protease adaptor protein ClpS [Bacteriovorax sp. DB6_IX]